MRISDYLGNQIELTVERWHHIIAEHPELKKLRNRLSEILSDPDLVKRSRRDKDVLLYYRYYSDVLGGKYLIVVITLKERPFLLTCYVTDKIKEGDIIWRRN